MKADGFTYVRHKTRQRRSGFDNSAGLLNATDVARRPSEEVLADSHRRMPSAALYRGIWRSLHLCRMFQLSCGSISHNSPSTAPRIMVVRDL